MEEKQSRFGGNHSPPALRSRLRSSFQVVRVLQRSARVPISPGSRRPSSHEISSHGVLALEVPSTWRLASSFGMEANTRNSTA